MCIYLTTQSLKNIVEIHVWIYYSLSLMDDLVAAEFILSQFCVTHKNWLSAYFIFIVFVTKINALQTNPNHKLHQHS